VLMLKNIKPDPAGEHFSMPNQRAPGLFSVFGRICVGEAFPADASR